MAWTGLEPWIPTKNTKEKAAMVRKSQPDDSKYYIILLDAAQRVLAGAGSKNADPEEKRWRYA